MLECIIIKASGNLFHISMDKKTEKHILRRYLNGTYTKSEVDSIQDCLSDMEQHLDVWNELADEVWEESANHQQTSVFSHARKTKEAQRILRRAQNASPSIRRRFYTVITGIAASFLIIVASTFAYQYFSESHEIRLTQVQTSFGEKKQITLPDGSHIILNSCSRLQYPDHFSHDSRNVELSGEAFFEITPNKEKPFYVRTGLFNVKVLGTAFNVKAYTGDEIVSVGVDHGKVQVELPEATLRLQRHEQISFNAASGEYHKTIHENTSQWKKGYFSFHNTPIQDVVRELEREYNCRIVFQQGVDFHNLITGEHDRKDLKSILESLHYISGINYRIENEVVTFYK